MNNPGQNKCSLVSDCSKDPSPFSLKDVDVSQVPALSRFLRFGDKLKSLGEKATEVLVERPISTTRVTQILHASIGQVGRPKDNNSGGSFLRVDLPNCSAGPDSMLLSADAIRRYFYRFELDGQSSSLYKTLGVCEMASLTDLRLAWRVRSIETGLTHKRSEERAEIERAFNLLAHPDLRNCYDELLRDETAPPVFPYGGFGTIMVEGNPAKDGNVFFGKRILWYKPEISLRRAVLLLRRCEFLTDRIVCRDSRRKLEVWIDPALLPGIRWDLTWNHWKHWLRSRIELDAAFVRTGKNRHLALPSRIQVVVPEAMAADIERARATHTLLGDHAEVIEKIRAEVEKQPVEHVLIQDWFDRLGVSSQVEPQQVTWRPDYEPYYFEQLRGRCATWFLVREEYLFVLPNVVIAEIPQPGHATYVFAKPEDVGSFMSRYAGAVRKDIRRNCGNVATALGFVGRVSRGRNKQRWLNEVLKVSGLSGD